MGRKKRERKNGKRNHGEYLSERRDSGV